MSQEAPRPSRNGDLSHSMMSGPTLGEKATALALALGIFAGGKVIFDSQSAKGQSPSPVPSTAPSFEPLPSITPDPITGLLPCPSPTPAPSESIIPDRTLPPDIGQIPGEAVIAQGQNSNGETVTLTLAQELPSAPPSVEPGTSPTPDPETAVICPSPEPSPILTASPEAIPSGPAPDSFEVLLDSKIDPKAKISQATSAINKMYNNEGYKESLKRLHASYDEGTPVSKAEIIDFLERCNDEKALSDKVLLCSGNISNFIVYARQFPLNSGNPIDAAINAVFAKGARTIRSATVNSGVPVGRLDRNIRSDAEYFDNL